MTRGNAIVLTVLWLATSVQGAAVTVYDVQVSDAASGWQSAYLDQTLDVTGGIVIYSAVPSGKSFARVVIQDPSFSDWAGVEVKLLDATPPSAFPLGQRVELTSVGVDESWGTTYLIYDSRPPAEGGYGSGVSASPTSAVVEPTVVDPLILGYAEPISSPQDEEAANTSADPAATEKYEGMLLKIEDVHVNVGAVGFGSHNDNYELVGLGGACWASDYLNVDRTSGDDYHPWTQTGQGYDAVVGVLEQYTKSSSGYDYYQLLTRGTADFVPAPPAAVLLSAGAVALLGRRRRS